MALVPRSLFAQDDSPKEDGRHGRKYKAPPETSEIEVTVLKGFNKKPIMNAAVVFHPVDADGKDEGFLEMKTDPDGKAKIDVIPTGSQVRIQVIATGFATYAEDYKIAEPQRKITIDMQRPRAQVSTYVDEFGKPSTMKPGVQEPVRPKLGPDGRPLPQSAPTPSATSGSASGNSATGQQPSQNSNSK
ncbi:MAG TPA: hypothetical protein VN612_01390 [Acidobacteriaceae bacterium]|nr:hypothetical protein [Acidobacteriaceae bacterium]